LFFYYDRRWRAAVNAVTRGRRASALARRSARSEHMRTSTEIVSEIVSPGFCARLPWCGLSAAPTRSWETPSLSYIFWIFCGVFR